MYTDMLKLLAGFRSTVMSRWSTRYTPPRKPLIFFSCKLHVSQNLGALKRVNGKVPKGMLNILHDTISQYY